MSVRSTVTDFLILELKKLYPDWPIIQAKQNVPIEYDKYFVLDLLAETTLGSVEKWDTENEKINILGVIQSTVNIQAFGSGCIEALSELSILLEKPTVVDDFHAANIAVNTVGNVNDITALLDDSRYQERASVDLTVSYDRKALDDPGWFDRLRIQCNLAYLPSIEFDVVLRKER